MSSDDQLPQLLFFGKVFISPLLCCLHCSISGQFCQVKHSWLAGFFFSLSLKTLTISSPFLIVSKVSAVNPTDSFMGAPLYEMKLFVLVSFLPLTRSKTLPDFLTVFLCSLSVESYFGWIYMETYEFHVHRNEKLSVW